MKKLLDLFSGVAGFSLAFERAGFETAAFSEIEPFPCSVLAHRWPDVPNLGDITKWREWDWDAIGHIDVVTFGSPCQDLSVAGKRAGLIGERSGLFHEAINCVRRSGARYALWENVPGAFSSNKGQDFRTVLEEILQAEVPMPRSGRWSNAGMVRGNRCSIAWRVLDAQHFGVPQRRRRVFLVADFGGERAHEILFESEGLLGHPAPGGEAGEEASGGSGDGAKSAGFCAGNSALAGSIGFDEEMSPTLRGASSGTHQVPSIIQQVAGTAVAVRTAHTGANGIGGDPDAAHTLDGTQGQAVAFHCMQDPIYGEISPALSAGNQQGISTTAVAFQQNQRDEVRLVAGDGNLAGALSAEPGMKQQNYIAQPVGIDGGNTGFARRANPSASGDKGDGGMNTTQVIDRGMAVRRLTPLEAERLQGFPDGWTDVPHGGKPAADGPRYRALGNSVAVPVVEWIARRMMEAR